MRLRMLKAAANMASTVPIQPNVITWVWSRPAVKYHHESADTDTAASACQTRSARLAVCLLVDNRALEVPAREPIIADPGFDAEKRPHRCARWRYTGSCGHTRDCSCIHG